MFLPAKIRSAKRRPTLLGLCVVAALLGLSLLRPSVLCACAPDAQGVAPGLSLSAQDETPPGAQPVDEKDGRTPAQRKINSQLLYALYRIRGEAAQKGTPVESGVEVDERGRVLIDIRARVTKRLIARVEKLGGKVISSSERSHTILARFPLEKIEILAGDTHVKFIEPAAEATTN
jgi:hypothetical protein